MLRSYEAYLLYVRVTHIEPSEDGALRGSLAAAVCSDIKSPPLLPDAFLLCLCVAELECRPPCQAGPGPVGQVQRAGHQVHYQDRGICQTSAWVHGADHRGPDYAPESCLPGHSGGCGCFWFGGSNLEVI